MIDVIIVEDSRVARELLVHILESDPAINVMGASGSGYEVLELLRKKRPHVITMDIEMPGLDGFETTRKIMETSPVPIVIVSAKLNPGRAENVFKSLEAGAVAVVEKPPGPGHAEYETLAADLVRMVKLMAEVKVIRRWGRPPPAAPPLMTEQQRSLFRERSPIDLVVLGASTGGPQAIQKLIKSLEAPLPVPILVVQHIAQGFMEGFVEWLRNSTKQPAEIAAAGELPRAGHIYFPPDDFHMELDGEGRFILHRGEKRHGMRPSVSVLFRSAAQRAGRRVIAIILTGMGRDGADEMKALRDLGALTFAQDQDSCVVFGMPREAIELGAAQFVMSPEEIGAQIHRFFNSSPHIGSQGARNE